MEQSINIFHNRRSKKKVTMSAARKAWNEAMKATAGASALPPSLQQGSRKRRSDRQKKKLDRRSKARKAQGLMDDNDDEYRQAVWLDALEGVDPTAPGADDEDDEYDELNELENQRKGRGRRRGGTAKKDGSLPKRFLPRSLGSILLEEHSRPDGVARQFLTATALLPPEQQLPRRKFCPVTGLLGIYTDPKSGIPYASLKALEQIQERPPPWMMLGGSAAFHEAEKSILEG